MEPAVVTVAGLKDCTIPQIAAEVSAAAGEGVHLAIATRQSVRQSVSMVVFIRMELSPWKDGREDGQMSDRRLVRFLCLQSDTVF